MRRKYLLSDPSMLATWTLIHGTAVRVLPKTLVLLGVPEEEVEDVLQDILLTAFGALERFDPQRSACAVEAQTRVLRAAAAGDPRPISPEELAARVWLFGIAWRRVRRYLDVAYRRRERPVGLASGVLFRRVEEGPGPEQRMAQDERLALAVGLLEAIEPERRAVLILKDAFDVPIAEIAEAFRINENTARNRLRLARRDYRAAVRRMRPEDRRALRGALVAPLFPAGLLRAAGAPPARAVDRAADPSGGARPAPERPRAAALGRRLGRLATAAAAGVASVLLPAADPGESIRPIAAAAAGLEVPARRAAAAIEVPARTTAAIEVPARTTAAIEVPVQVTGPTARALGAARGGPRQAAPGEGKDPLLEEVRLLAQAREAVSHGHRSAALEVITAHARRFPGSQLAWARETLRERAQAAVGPAGARAGGGGR